MEDGTVLLTKRPAAIKYEPVEERQMRKLPLRLVGVAAVMFLLSENSVAQSSDLGRIGTVRIARVMQESAEGKRAFETYQKKWAAKAEEIEKKRNELQLLQKQYQDQSRTLNEEIRSTMEKTIATKNTEIQRAQEDSQREMALEQNEIASRILSRLVPVLESYSKEQNFALILNQDIPDLLLYLYVRNGTDVTQEIITRFDATRTLLETNSPKRSGPPIASPKPADKTP